MRLAALAALVVGLFACRPAATPRHVARGAVLSVAYAVQVADKLCAQRAYQIAGLDDQVPVSAPVSKVRDLPVASQAAVAVTRAGYASGVEADSKLGEAIALAEKCQQGYSVARPGLIAAAEAVDAWGAIEKDGQVACGMQEAASGLNHIVAAVQAYGVKMPPAVTDAQIAVGFIGSMVEMKTCKVSK